MNILFLLFIAIARQQSLKSAKSNRNWLPLYCAAFLGARNAVHYSLRQHASSSIEDLLCARVYALSCWYLLRFKPSFELATGWAWTWVWEREHSPHTSFEYTSACWSHATVCVVTSQHQKDPITLSTCHSFQPTSHLWKCPEMVLLVPFFCFDTFL